MIPQKISMLDYYAAWDKMEVGFEDDLKNLIQQDSRPPQHPVDPRYIYIMKSRCGSTSIVRIF